MSRAKRQARSRFGNVALYRGGGDRFVRYFYNGAVILNMTEDAWSLNLGTTYSPDGYARLLGTLAAGDAVNTGVQGNGADRTEFFVPAEKRPTRSPPARILRKNRRLYDLFPCQACAEKSGWSSVVNSSQAR